MHIVHYKSTHADITAAVTSTESDALAVVGFFFEVI